MHAAWGKLRPDASRRALCDHISRIRSLSDRRVRRGVGRKAAEAALQGYGLNMARRATCKEIKARLRVEMEMDVIEWIAHNGGDSCLSGMRLSATAGCVFLYMYRSDGVVHPDWASDEKVALVASLTPESSRSELFWHAPLLTEGVLGRCDGLSLAPGWDDLCMYFESAERNAASIQHALPAQLEYMRAQLGRLSASPAPRQKVRKAADALSRMASSAALGGAGGQAEALLRDFADLLVRGAGSGERVRDLLDHVVERCAQERSIGDALCSSGYALGLLADLERLRSGSRPRP